MTGIGLYFFLKSSAPKSHYSDKRLLSVTQKIKNEMYFVNLQLAKLAQRFIATIKRKNGGEFPQTMEQSLFEELTERRKIPRLKFAHYPRRVLQGSIHGHKVEAYEDP